MTNIKIKNIEKVISLDNKFNFMIIENNDFFYKIINAIREDIDSVITFYNENYEQLYLEKNVEVISDFINVDCAKTKYVYDFIKVNKLMNDEDVKLKLSIIYPHLDCLIDSIKFSSILDLDFDENIDLEYLLKSIGLRFHNSTNRVKRLIDYCRILYEIYKKGILFFVNLNNYYTYDEMLLILNELYLIGIKSIIISTNSNNLEKNNDFSKIIIDKDLCEFYN